MDLFKSIENDVIQINVINHEQCSYQELAVIYRDR